MAEESNNAVLTEEGQKAAALLSTIESNPDLVAMDPNLKNFVEQAKKVKDGTVSDNGKQSDGNPENKEENIPENKPADKNETKSEKTEKEDTGSEKSVFFNKKKTDKIKIAKTEDAIQYIKDKFNVDVNEKDGWGKLLGSIDKWRNDSQDKAEAERKVENLETAIQNMPEPLIQGMDSWAKGLDWKEPFKNIGNGIDFKRDVSDINKKDLVEHYFPGELNQEDWDDKDNQIVPKTVKLAEKNFTTDQKIYNEKRQFAASDAKRKLDAVRESADKTVSKLKDSFPDMADKEIKNIEKLLDSGEVSGRLFINSDGTYKPDAAKKLAFALYGEQEITNRVYRAKTEARSEANEEIVNRGADNPNVSKRQSQSLPSELKDKMKIFEGILPQNTYGQRNQP